MIEFFVAGRPATKGSTKSFRSRSTGRIVTMSDNAHLASWEARAARAAREAMGRPTFAADAEKPLLVGPVSLTCNFWIARPRSHFINGDGLRLRRSAPMYHAQKLDLDKLIRAIGDAATKARVIKDDGQIAVIDSRKLWAPAGQGAGVSVIVEALEGGRSA